MTTTPKRRGRPPSAAPKTPKPPVKMGRPSKWPEALQPAGKINHGAPLVLDELLELDDFRQKFTDLMLDFLSRK